MKNISKVFYSVSVLTAVFVMGLFVFQSNTVFGEDEVAMGKIVVQKVVINDNGGIKDPSSFSFQVNGAEPVTFENDGRNTIEVAPGNYTVTEPAYEGYTSSLEGCTEIEVTPGSKNTCVITNDDIAPATGSLKVSKKTNDGDGVFTFKIIGTKTVFDITTVEGEGSYTLEGLLPDVYSIREEVQEGWEMTANTCVDVEVVAGKTAECKIRNTMVVVDEGEDPTKGTFIIEKTVVNDNGNTATISDFPGFTINGENLTPFKMYQEDSMKGLNVLKLEPGVYSISEPETAGYAKTMSENCIEVTIVAGETQTCSLINDDVAQGGGGSGGGTNADTNTGGGSVGGNNTVTPTESTGPSTPAPAGEVLGESTENTSCTPYVTTYMRLGAKNNPEEVKLLQAFLNENLTLNPALKVDGVFGKSTKNAVIAFQEKYKDEVLIPWKSFGLKEERGTGIVYKTTLRWINMVKCSSLNIPMPQLP